jgi:hypothetical protein
VHAARAGVALAVLEVMRAAGYVVVILLGAACHGGGGFGHAFSGLGHGLGHAASGIGHAASHVGGHAASGLAHGVGHAGGKVPGKVPGTHVGGVRTPSGGADVVADVVDNALDLAANVALDNGTAIVVVDGVDPVDPCVLEDGHEITCDAGYTCVPRAGEAICVLVAAPGTTPP